MRNPRVASVGYDQNFQFQCSGVLTLTSYFPTHNLLAHQSSKIQMCIMFTNSCIHVHVSVHNKRSTFGREQVSMIMLQSVTIQLLYAVISYEVLAMLVRQKERLKQFCWRITLTSRTFLKRLLTVCHSYHGQYQRLPIQTFIRCTSSFFYQKEEEKRRDFRQECVFTIDPETARVSIENYTLILYAHLLYFFTGS